MKTIGRLAAVLLIFSVLSACQGGSSGGAEREGSDISIAISQTIPALDPQGSNDEVNALVSFGNVAEGLVAMSGDSDEVLPVLATKWEQVNPTTLRFSLREGVKFQNGEVFDAAAVEYSVKRMLTQQGPGNFAHYYAALAEDPVKIIDDHTVDIMTSAPAPTLLRNLTFLMIVPPKAAADATAFASKPVGTGPFALVKKTTDSVVLERNPSYWGDKPEASKVTLLSRPEAGSRVAALQAGEVDLAYDIPAAQSKSVPKYETTPGLETVLLRLDGRHGVTADLRVRQAINLAIDVEQLRTSLVTDDASASADGQIAAQGVFGHDDSLSAPTVDVDRAKALIKEAGATGKQLRLAVPQGRYSKGTDVCEAIVNELRAIGLDAKLEVLEYQAWLDAAFEKDGVEALFVGINADQRDLAQSLSAVVTASSDLSRFPADEFADVQSMIVKSGSTTDSSQREQELFALNKRITESAAFVPLYVPNIAWGAQEDISWDKRQDPRILLATVKFGSK